MSGPATLAVKLTTKAEKIVKKGHPWVFSDSIVKLNKKGKAGDLVILFDHQTDKVYAIGLYDPDSAIRVKIIHRGKATRIDRHFFEQKVEEARQIREPLLETDTNAYRLIFGENDGFPGLILDIYNKTGVLKLYTEAWFPYLELLIPVLVKVAKPAGLVLRLSRKLQRSQNLYQEGQILYGELTDPEVLFKEYGLYFKTNVLKGHKTGFFLDHRANRHQIGQLAKDKTVLDVFAYAGGFSVHALAGGARSVTAVDLSRQALQLAEENAALNTHTGTYHTLAGDAFVLLQELIQQQKQYDIVIIDPPSFAKSRQETGIALKKYEELATLGALLTQKGGLLLLASCSSRVPTDEFLVAHQKAFTRQRTTYTLETLTHHDTDHPVIFEEGAYLKSAYYRIF